MLAYEKGAIKLVPRRGGVDALLSTSSCSFFKLQIPNTAEDPVVSVYPSLCFLSLCHNFSLLFMVLIASCFPIFWGVATDASLFFSLSMQSNAPTKLRIFFGISSLPPCFFEVRESWREGFLDLLTKIKCKEERG